MVIRQVGGFTKPNGLLGARVRRESDATPERKSFLEFFPEEGEKGKGRERWGGMYSKTVPYSKVGGRW